VNFTKLKIRKDEARRIELLGSGSGELSVVCEFHNSKIRYVEVRRIELLGFGTRTILSFERVKFHFF
jgi:hypothetical protein